jgi:RNA polymerase sigma-32 factor
MYEPIDRETAQYIARVQALPALSKEEELALARELRDHGDQAAAQRIVATNLRHVVPLAMRYRRLGPPLSELIAQGNLGLLQALRRFDPARQLRFATYANHWVRAEILSYVLRTRTLVGGGRGDLRARYAFRLRRDHARPWSAQQGEDDSLSALAVEYGKTPAEISRLLARQEQRDASFDAPLAGGSELTLHDQLPANVRSGEELLSERTALPELSRAVAAATAELDERDRFIVEHRLMADDEAQLSLQEIGRRFGVSRERARQLEQRVKARLRERLSTVVSHFELLSSAA